jgi:hypothetical protein
MLSFRDLDMAACFQTCRKLLLTGSASVRPVKPVRLRLQRLPQAWDRN